MSLGKFLFYWLMPGLPPPGPFGEDIRAMTTMREIETAMRRTRATNHNAAQIRKAFMAWYGQLPWFERSIGNQPTIIEGKKRLTAFLTVNRMPVAFGAERATLKPGASGPDVEAWQQGIGAAVTGIHNAASVAATKAWQQSHGLTVDGIVGPQSWGSLPEKAPSKVVSAVKSVALNKMVLLGVTSVVGGGLAFVFTGDNFPKRKKIASRRR